MIKKTPLIAITILAVALAVVGPTFSINSAAGVGAAKGGANGEPVSAEGSVTCPDGSIVTPPDDNPFNGVTTAFNATQTPLAHYIIIIAGQGERSGDISKVHVTSNNFQFTGIGAPVCPPSSDLTTISMRGQCGPNETVRYEAENGEKGSLGPVNVQCNP